MGWRNHGFVDGNKRTSIYAVALLLRLSGDEMPFGCMRALNNAMEKIVADEPSLEGRKKT
jgi:prophage maintenance system killer protein